MKPVFIHINKTAGTSIVSAAGDHIVDAGHRTAASWIAEHGRGAPLFSVIRHPYDRMLSEYNYRRRRFRAGENNAHLANLSLPVDAWVVATFQDEEYRTRAYFDRTGVPFRDQNMLDDVLIWFVPQVRWLSGADGELLVDDVLRFEQLRADWAAFGSRQRFACELPHHNRSSGGSDAATLLGERARDVIFEYHRDDFETFGYER